MKKRSLMACLAIILVLTQAIFSNAYLHTPFQQVSASRRHELPFELINLLNR
jgi:hypothetical protein